MTDDMYQKVETGELLKWEEEGTTIEGILVNYEQRDTSKGVGHIYEVENKDNQIIPFFAPSDLRKKLKNIAIPSIVKVTYVKKSRTMSGNDWKEFEVFHAELNDVNLKKIGMEPMKKVETEPANSNSASDEIDVEEVFNKPE